MVCVQMHLCFELSFLSRERNFSILEIDKLNATRSVSAELTHRKNRSRCCLVVTCYSLVASPIKVLTHTYVSTRATACICLSRIMGMFCGRRATIGWGAACVSGQRAFQLFSRIVASLISFPRIVFIFLPRHFHIRVLFFSCLFPNFSLEEIDLYIFVANFETDLIRIVFDFTIYETPPYFR